MNKKTAKCAWCHYGFYPADGEPVKIDEGTDHEKWLHEFCVATWAFAVKGGQM